MIATDATHGLTVIDEGTHNETTYMVDKCVVKIKYLPIEESDTSREKLEQIRNTLFSVLGI